ncbi:hypothetical protein SIM91_05465 [Rhodococcus opacus]|uniref:hypothetical protein n=1 Tax=Rhodococcus opacus TaxID=37919 RepID=UPI00226554F7|nr:hypothetical protein [Rhodococcus opacus]MDX5962765.1 hypothetical protein [Rhodococcus opacus]
MPSRRTIETAVALACRAPSLYNSQPWRWVLGSQDLSLFSDPDRILPATDAFGRQMVLSCGAALNHLRYAFASLRWTSVIDRLPHSQGRQCLATIGLAPAQDVSDTDDRMATAITRRRTERLPMDPPGRWDQTFAQVTELAAQSGTHLEDIGEHGRPELEAMSRRLSGLRRADPVYQAELRWWAGHSLYPEGIPAEALRPRDTARSRSNENSLPETSPPTPETRTTARRSCCSPPLRTPGWTGCAAERRCRPYFSPVPIADSRHAQSHI